MTCLKLATVSIFLAMFINGMSAFMAPSPVCEFGFGKCLGKMDFNMGEKVASSRPLTEFMSTRTQCQNSCIRNASCWTAEWKLSESDGNCRLFNRSTTSTKLTLGYVTYKWVCCFLTSCRRLSNRCHGLWSKRISSVIHGSRILSTITKPLNYEVCLEKCLQHPLCADINYFDTNICELLAINPKKTYWDNTSSAEVYEWTCCAHEDTDLSKECRPIPGKCNARWKAINLPRSNFTQYAIGHFITMKKHVCLDVCEKNPFCYEVLFSQSYAMCLLLSNKTVFSRDYPTLPPSMSGITDWYDYRWQCCQPYHVTRKPEYRPLKNAKCLCLNLTRHEISALAADGCVEPLVDQAVLANLSGAAFWVMNDKEVLTINKKIWKRIFNGNIYMWIMMNHLKKHWCPTHHCNIYSTVVRPGSLPKIVKRAEWFALPPKRPLKKFPITPNKVVISNSVIGVFGCYSQAMCSYYVRLFQRDHQQYLNMPDIAYNYAIGEDGRVYEGCGSDYMGSDTNVHHYDSISIGFIGWYRDRSPNVKSIEAARQLLQYLVNTKKLNKNYKLYGMRDIESSEAPAKYLYKLLPTWGHYTHLKLPVGYSCSNFYATRLRKVLIYVSIPTLGSVFLIIIVAVYFKIYIHHKWCPKRRLQSFKNENSRQRCIRCFITTSPFVDPFTGNWPTKCISRQAETVHIPPNNIELLIISSTELECRCSAMFSNLWCRCVTESLFEFSSFAKQLKRWCSAHVVLLWTDKVYLFHGFNLTEIQEILKYFVEGNCVCHVNDFHVDSVKVPHLDNEDSFNVNNELTFDASRILNQKLHRFEQLSNYCRYFETKDSIKAEITYRDFERIPRVEETSITFRNSSTPLIQ